jgi:hypothetical protein
LFIIESGVVSVMLTKDGRKIESGRMGPGSDRRGGDSVRRRGAGGLCAKTFCACCTASRRNTPKPCLDARHDISEAMKSLLDFRLHAAQALTQDAPVVPVKKGFLQWLRKRGHGI